MALNALSATTDIQTVAALVAQAQTGGADINPEYFYNTQLLDTLRLDADQFCYYRLATTSPIQGKADKLVLRRWSSLQGHTQPLAEGVPPVSDKGSVKQYELTAYQYGRYMEFTDVVSFKVVDPIIAYFTKEYSLVAIETLDLLAREALLLNAQIYYAGGALTQDTLTFANARPNMTDLRKIILAMKKSLVKPMNNGKFQVIGSAEFYFDMLADATVQAYMTLNQTTKTMYDGGLAPLVPMFGMEFYETMVVPTSGEYVDADGHKRLKIYTGTVAAPTFANGTTTIDLIETSGTNYTLVSGYEHDAFTGQDASYIPNKPTWHLDTATVAAGTAQEFKMQHVLVIGKDALVRTGLSGEDNAKMYVKGLGSTGVLDPIDQRQSIGFKINSVGFGSTRPEAIYDYICVPSMVNL